MAAINSKWIYYEILLTALTTTSTKELRTLKKAITQEFFFSSNNIPENNNSIEIVIKFLLTVFFSNPDQKCFLINDFGSAKQLCAVTKSKFSGKI